MCVWIDWVCTYHGKQNRAYRKAISTPAQKWCDWNPSDLWPCGKASIAENPLSALTGASGSCPSEASLECADAQRLVSASAIPLAWICLDHLGQSANRHWVELLDYLERILPLDKQVIILADREFGSVDRLRYVVTKGWHYAIRLKAMLNFMTDSGDNHLTGWL